MTVVETKDRTIVGTIAGETNNTITIDDGTDYVTINKSDILEMYED